MFEGILFIGDVHFDSRRVGRRIDDYTQAALDKLDFCAQLARAKNLLPVCLGDLFNRYGENHLPSLNRLIEVLRRFPVPLIVLSGSHDRQGSWVSETDAIELLHSLSVIDAVDEVCVRRIEVGASEVSLCFVPHGHAIPDAFEVEGTGVLVTHHDLAFKGPYPGAQPLKPVQGVVLWVNGHMHTRTNPVDLGDVTAYNPGALLRPSVDLRAQVPVVSLWYPDAPRALQFVDVPCAMDVFDLTGLEVEGDERMLKAQLPSARSSMSEFAKRLREQSHALNATRSQDGSILLESLKQVFSQLEVSDATKRYMTNLLREVVDNKR